MRPATEAEVLLLYCCFTAALLSDAQMRPATEAEVLLLYCCFTAALLLLYCYLGEVLE
jgi:hypothetical protein